MSETPHSPPPSHTPYIVAVCVIGLLGLVTILIIQRMHPDQDNTALITLVIGFLAPTTTSILALMKAQETHLSVNSRLDEFMKMAKEASHAEGVLEGQSMPIHPQPTKPTKE